MKGVLPKFGFALVAILMVAAMLLTLGQRETYSRPSATSYNPSGLRAFADLLQANGIRTEVTRLEKPRLSPNDLVIAAYVETGPTIFGRSPLDPVEKSIENHMKRGGHAIALPFDQDFRAKSFEAMKASKGVNSVLTGETLKINTSTLSYGSLSGWDGGATTESAGFLPIEGSMETYAAWYREDESTSPYMSLAAIGSGILCRPTDGLFASNRFIDRNDNAEFALRMVKGLLKTDGKVVFAEAALGGGLSPSLTSTLGPWASGMASQLAILFIVIIFTLGIRFGLPEIEQRKQAGQREMIDAISDVYLRAKSTSVALDVAYLEADRIIRRALKLPAHTSPQDRDRVLPEALLTILSEVDRMRKPFIVTDKKGRPKTVYRADPQVALQMIQKLETELHTFVPKARNRLS